jgi:hypothetical protein
MMPSKPGRGFLDDLGPAEILRLFGLLEVNHSKNPRLKRFVLTRHLTRYLKIAAWKVNWPLRVIWIDWGFESGWTA